MSETNPKPKASSKTKAPAASKNSSAPVQSGKSAEVLATEGAQASSQASTSAVPGTPPVVEAKKLPPTGGKEPIATHAIVVAKKEGFRRAGRPWSVEPTTVSLDELSKEQLEALLGEPQLDVSFLAE